MNRLLITGNLTKDIDVILSKNDILTGKFTIANNYYIKEEKQVMFLNCVMFGDKVEKLEKYLLKGCKVLLNGRLQINTIQDNEEYKTFTSLLIEEIEIIKFVDEIEKEAPKEEKKNKYNKYKK